MDLDFSSIGPKAIVFEPAATSFSDLINAPILHHLKKFGYDIAGVTGRSLIVAR